MYGVCLKHLEVLTAYYKSSSRRNDFLLEDYILEPMLLIPYSENRKKNSIYEVEILNQLEYVVS